MSKVNEIIQNMSLEVRAKAEAYAKAKGLSLEAAVAKQLDGELSDGDLEAIAGGCNEYITETSSGWEYVSETQ